VGSAFAASSFASARPDASSKTLDVVGYSTPGPVYGSATTPGTLEYAFAHTKAGKGVTFNNSFGPSDSQAQLVENGLPADVVNFSYAVNIQSLVAKKLVPKTWAQTPYHGDVTDSVVAFGVRPGNPKHIKNWNDLVKSGVGVVTPSTTASGSAKWNILGAYGAASDVGKHKNAGLSYLRKLFKNIKSQPTSGSKAVAAFLSGIGDVVIGYEDDIENAASSNPGKIQLVVPAHSLLIENPISWTNKPASQNKTLAQKFISFLLSKAGQTIWAKHYYEPVLKSVASKYHFPKPKTLFNIRQLGGWPKLDPEFFDPNNGLWPKIENGG
jgi:sulfate transport system substrate-binding protein